MLMRTVPIRREASMPSQSALCGVCEVRPSGLFGVLGDGALDGLHRRLDRDRFAADEVLFQRGEQGSSLFTIRSGIVRFERVTERGDRRIVRLVGRGALIGQEALLHDRYADDAIACTPVEVCRIPRAVVEELGVAEPRLCRELMRRWQGALDEAETWGAELTAGPSRRRLLHLLVKLAELAPTGEPIWLPRREEIGAMLDLTEETSSRLVSQLRREGVLALDGLRHATLDHARLGAALRREDEA